MDELQESSQKSCNARKNMGHRSFKLWGKRKSDILMVEKETFPGLSMKNTWECKDFKDWEIPTLNSKSTLYISPIWTMN